MTYSLIGQVLIANSDILIVKHFFPAEAAGQYAALALIGRIVFFGTASVVAAMFPIVAQREQRGESHSILLWAALGLVAVASLAVVFGSLFFSELCVLLLFGESYLSVAPLLWLYALATAFYALANVVVNYRLAAGRGGASMLLVIAGICQVSALWFVHGSLYEVVFVQVILMGSLLAVLLVWDQAGMLFSRKFSMGSATQFIQRNKHRLILWSLICLAVLFTWQFAHAQEPLPANAAQRQVMALLPTLVDSEAEGANGAYIPEMGAVFAIDLLRGPNTTTDKAPEEGTRDWAVYLLQTFGPTLDAVPQDERIAISVHFYDFPTRNYRQLVVSSVAASVGDPNTYTVWLDGQYYGGVQPDAQPAQPNVTQDNNQANVPEATTVPEAQPDTASIQPTAQPETQTSIVLDPTPSTNEAPDTQASTVFTDPQQAPATLSFDTPTSGEAKWKVVNGIWASTESGYEQTELGSYDLTTVYQERFKGNYTLETKLRFVEGEMGGGLLFNLPAGNTKKGAQMVGLTGNGTYIQWGIFDNSGVFQYQGGVPIASVADGKDHTLSVTTSAETFTIFLDGKELGRDIPLSRVSEGYVGLFASTSHMIFSDVRIGSVGNQ